MAHAHAGYAGRMTVSWRSRAPWLVATVLVIAGAVLLVLGAPTDMSASFGWFAYAPLAMQSYSPTGIPLSVTSLTGLLVAALGSVALAFLTGRWIGRRSDPAQTTARGRVRTAWWGAAAVIVVGVILAVPGWISAQPIFTYDESYIAFADGWSAASPEGLLVDGFMVARVALVGTLLVLGGLMLAAFLLGVSRAPRGTAAPRRAARSS